MEPTKLLLAGGLGVSATTAIAGPGALLGTPSTKPLPPAYGSTLFTGLKSDSANLYQTFDQHCVKELFPNLHNSEAINGQAYGSADASQFQLSTPSVSGTATGCLRLNFKHYTENQKSTVIDTIEMAAHRGDHGFILLNSVTNMLQHGGNGFFYRALFLKKEGTNWKVQTGIQWHDTMFTDSNIPDKMKWTLPDSKSTGEMFWEQSICTVSKECDSKLQTMTPEEKETTYEWKPGTGTKNLYQALKLENLSTHSVGYGSDFWSGEETPVQSYSTISVSPSGAFINGHWKKIGKLFNGDPTTFQNWFTAFKDGKGEWKEKTLGTPDHGN